ncbi:MAG: hypothetical protein J6K48_15690 [Lachnospiraceae bacterium]|nr:hypothetical protein [Lachnospiraceae bacterium]
MGNGRLPTERQKQRIRAAGLNPRDYLVLWSIEGKDGTGVPRDRQNAGHRNRKRAHR